MIIRRLRRQGKEKQPTPSFVSIFQTANCPQVFDLENARVSVFVYLFCVICGYQLTAFFSIEICPA
jgi:hypothetical protein